LVRYTASSFASHSQSFFIVLHRSSSFFIVLCRSSSFFIVAFWWGWSQRWRTLNRFQKRQQTFHMGKTQPFARRQIHQRGSPSRGLPFWRAPKP
jgi:hypothetical protein